MSPWVAVAEMCAVPAERPLTWAVARPSAGSLVMSATVATLVSLESKLMPRPRMVRLNWSKARAVKRAAVPVSIVCEGGSREMPASTEARSTKKAPSALTPGENLLAGAAAVWRTKAPEMSGARVMDWLTESPPRPSPARP
jgi:hypothetical protein